MAQPGKYTVLVMHDNGKTRRYRISTRLLHTLLVFFLLLPFVAGAAIWFGYTNWQKNSLLASTNQTLMEDLAKSEMELHRLANLETFLAENEPRTLQNLIEDYTPAPAPSASSSAPSVNTSSGVLADASGAASAATTPADPAIVPANTASNEAGTAGTPQGTSAQAPAVTNGQAPAATETQATSGSPQEPAVTGPDIPLENLPMPEKDGERMEVNTGLVRVENLSARRVGMRSLRIAFDLYNTEMQPQVSGKTTFDLILADGTMYTLPPQGDTRFRINRLKRITSNPALPLEVTNETSLEGASIRVTVIEGDDSVVYQSLVPLTDK